MAGGAAPRNVFTVDLEEWFHVCGVGGALAPARWDRLPSRVEDTTRRVLDLLDTAGVRATFFIVGWVADRFPALVAEVARAGHEIGSHGYAHRRAYDLGAADFRLDLEAGVKALASAGVAGVCLFRAPEWSVNERSLWALDILAATGFTLDASMAPLAMVGDVNYPRHPHVRRTAAGAILEVPPLVADRFGCVMPMGWGWGLRMSSPGRVLRVVEAENRHGRPAVFTLHPWEIDPEPPRVRLPPRLHFAHYFRLDGFVGRLRELLHSGMGFGPIGEVTASGDGW
jgi:polysaccharide deacetylase family protein (PEP-CTERM system associated)